MSSYNEYVLGDLMGEIDGVSSKAMFGGYGLYLNGKIFGMIINDEVYLKVSKDTESEFEKLGSKPFMYKHKSGKDVKMSYYQLPGEVADVPQKLKEWVQRSAGK
jgi:DNA transformation protein